MTLLSDTHYLKRAGRYSDPIDSNARLPVVYGNLTDGTSGIWTLPCLNKTDFVYAFAGHEVLSVANGNSIAIYKDGVLEAGGNYVFDELNNYEAEGNIATIDFAADPGNAVITARGMGKPTATGGATLMENIVDIVYDFLTVESDFTSALFDATIKARASQIFTSQAYKAAGIIHEDKEIWDAIIRMMASFLGSAYKTGADLLALDIDDGSVSLYGQPVIMRKSDAFMSDAIQRLVNIINQCPANYAYSYAEGGFKSETNDSAHADAASQSIYGTREPNTPYQFYWCRDLTSIQAIQDIIVAKFKDPVYEITVDDITMKNIQIDVGDHFVFSAESLYDKQGIQLTNQIWKCVSKLPDFMRGRITFRALQTEYYLSIAYLLDGTYLLDGSILAGGNRDTTIY